MTKVIHCRKEPYDVYIGRAVPRMGRPASKWANPYKVGRDGTLKQVLGKYLQSLVWRHDLLAAIAEELKDRILGCWCQPESGLTAPLVCHGQILAALADGQTFCEIYGRLETEHGTATAF